MSPATQLDLSQSFKLKPEFFFSSNTTHLQLINVANDDAIIFRFVGPCRTAFAELAKGKSVQEVKQAVMLEMPDRSSSDVDTFLLDFIKELTEMDLFDR